MAPYDLSLLIVELRWVEDVFVLYMFRELIPKLNNRFELGFITGRRVEGG